ncbi:MAG: hypothetical protein JWN23_474 [Rhodocyclales bacterium]|nr:hypothetical protein [Rhodocyclales bacterium]
MTYGSVEILTERLTPEKASRERTVIVIEHDKGIGVRAIARPRWHAVTISTGTMSIGKLVLTNFNIGTGCNQWPIGGILFSTFYGGHETR